MSETSQLSQVFSKGAGAGTKAGAGRWESCTAPKSGLVELGNWCNAKIVQVSCVEACVLRLPSSGLYGFSCLVVVVASAGQDLLLDLNGQQVRSCLDGIGSDGVGSVGGLGGSLLVSPVVGTRLEFRCDGQSWFIYSDYSRSLPVAATNSPGMNRMWIKELTSPTILTNSVNFVDLTKTGKIYKIVNGRNDYIFNISTYDVNQPKISGFGVANANDASVSAKYGHNRFAIIGRVTGITNQSVIGDSFVVVYDGMQFFACGSSFGSIEFINW